MQTLQPVMQTVQPGMQALPDLISARFLLLAAPDGALPLLLEAAARLALRGEVRVFDCGNRFDAFQVARLIRRRSPRLAEALECIQVSRAFTCYQVLALLAAAPASPAPVLAIDLLATFYDESVSLAESCRLVEAAAAHLLRLRLAAPVLAGVRPPRPEQAERGLLLEALAARADQIFQPVEPPDRRRVQPALFAAGRKE